jgi:acetyl esterase/lipase
MKRLSRAAWVLFAFVANAWAGAPETTPTELPGAESFVYRQDDKSDLHLFVVKPSGWKASDHRPAFVFFFGGGWTTGTPASVLGWAKFAAERGLVGIVPDYRTKGRHDTSPLASVSDGRAGLRWVQSHSPELGLDAERIVVGGVSAGGHVALWTALPSTPPGSEIETAPLRPPVALVLFSAVSDTSPETGYTPQRFGAEARALSPVHHLPPRMPPVLAFHGDADALVPLRQAIALRDQLQAAGNRCDLRIIPGGGHNFDRDLPGWAEKTQMAVAEFLISEGLIPAPTSR